MVRKGTTVGRVSDQKPKLLAYFCAGNIWENVSASAEDDAETGLGQWLLVRIRRCLSASKVHLLRTHTLGIHTR